MLVNRRTAAPGKIVEEGLREPKILEELAIPSQQPSPITEDKPATKPEYKIQDFVWKFMKDHGGWKWLKTTDGRVWLRSEDDVHVRLGLPIPGRVWLKTSDGKEWLRTSDGKAWLRTPDGEG